MPTAASHQGIPHCNMVISWDSFCYNSPWCLITGQVNYNLIDVYIERYFTMQCTSDDFWNMHVSVQGSSQPLVILWLHPCVCFFKHLSWWSAPVAPRLSARPAKHSSSAPSLIFTESRTKKFFCGWAAAPFNQISSLFIESGSNVWF